MPQSEIENAELWKFHYFFQSRCSDFRTSVEICSWFKKKLFLTPLSVKQIYKVNCFTNASKFSQVIGDGLDGPIGDPTALADVERL